MLLNTFWIQKAQNYRKQVNFYHIMRFLMFKALKNILILVIYVLVNGLKV